MSFIKTIDGCLKRVSPWAFMFLTLFMVLSRIPFFDEAWQFIISRLSLAEIFQITRLEGHPLIWYYLIKPFNVSLKLYPYPMILFGWVISSILIFFFWKKAGFCLPKAKSPDF